MEIEWPLVLFTALTGCGGWVAVCIAIDLFAGKTKRTNDVASVVAVVLLALGGCASVLHLQHPDRILGALSHPTSGIFVEAVLVGVCALALAVLFVMMKRGATALACKVVAVVAAALGVALAFMAGHSYMMYSTPAWDTTLLPLGYLLTAAPAGVGAYGLVAAVRGDGEALALYGKVLVVAGVAAALGAVAYGVTAQTSMQVTALWAGAAVLGGLVPAFLGALIARGHRTALGLWTTSAVCALIGAVAFRCVMWLSGVASSNFFGNL